MQPLTDLDYERFRDLFLLRTGLFFGENKRSDLAYHLSDAAHEYGSPSYSHYYDQLVLNTPQHPAWKAAIRHLTVNETYFFRDAGQFGALQHDILPTLIAQRREAKLPTLRLWSAGCSTGEEPYSIAILLRELIPDIERWSILISATDINRDSLQVAQHGIYKERSFRKETPDWIKAYFEQTEAGYSLKSKVQMGVRFDYLNLMDENYSASNPFIQGLDLIICRNVTIYFSQATTQQIVKQFYQALNPNGWLVVGHSEPMASVYCGFEPRNFEGAVIYQKVAPQAPEVSPIDKEITSPLMPPFSDTSQPGFGHPLPLIPASHPISSSEIHQTATDWYQIGKQAADQQDWDTAHRALTTAINHNPTMVEAHFAQALIYMQERNFQQALETLRRVLYLDSKFILAYLNQGIIYSQMHLERDARRAWMTADQLLKLFPPDTPLPHGDGLTADYVSKVVNGYLNRTGTAPLKLLKGK